MKSRTSSSKWIIFCKDLTRFSPLWMAWCAMYLVGGYMCYDWPVDVVSNYSPFIALFNIPNMLYGFACAACLFGYLHDGRECNTVHTWPIRREQLFFIHFLTGLTMSFVPAAFFCLAIFPISGRLLPFLFLDMQLQFLFYFGLGIFCMFLTGRRFAAAFLFVLINFLSLLVFGVVELLFLPCLPGIVLDEAIFLQFCPPAMLMYRSLYDLYTWNFGKDWLLLQPVYLIFAGIGLILVLFSMLLYRRRKLETAGNFLAVKYLAPLFTFAVSISFACIAVVLFGQIFNMDFSIPSIAALIIGHFAALMLMKRTVRVFRLKEFISLAVTLVIVFGSLFLTILDPLDRVYYVPEPDDVLQISVFDSQYEGADIYTTTDPDEIADLTDLHADVLETEAFTGFHDTVGHFYLHYTLENGQQITREYYLYSDHMELLERVNYYRSQPEFLVGTDDVQDFISRIRDLSFIYDGTIYDELTPEEIKSFADLFFEEAREGKMYLNSYTNDHTGISLEVSLYDDSGYSYYFTSIPTSAEKTLQWLYEHLPDVR